MRIIAGRWRGLRLAAVGKGDARNALRPTTDRVRESLFNILQNHVDFDGLWVLDLFAGTGALGVEALSRGAVQCTFVEMGRVGAGLITENIHLTGSAEYTNLIKRDATKLGDGTPHDLIFLDPPYGRDLGQRALQNAMARGWVAPDALVVWEEFAPMTLPGLNVQDTRKFGGSYITLLRAKAHP